MKTKIKIYEGGTLREMLRKCLEDGNIPADLETVWKLRQAGKIPMKGYDVGTVYKGGKIFKITKKIMRNIDNFYKEGGRLLCLDYDDYCGLIGVSRLGRHG